MKLFLWILVIFTINPSVIFPANTVEDYFWNKILNSPFVEAEIEPVTFGDELLLLDEFDLALHELKRERIGSLNPEEIDYSIAICYMKLGRLDEAKRVLNRLMVSDYYDMRIIAGRLLGFINITQKNYLAAQFEFKDLIGYTDELDFKAEWYYWLGWSYLLQYEFERADSQFSQITKPEFQSAHFYPSAYLILKLLRSDIDDINSKSPNLAKWLSTIIPGAGQIYLEDYISGAVSFGLNATFGYLTIASLVHSDYYQALIYYYFLWNRYYFGSGDNAYIKAIKYNESEKAEFIKSLMEAHLEW